MTNTSWTSSKLNLQSESTCTNPALSLSLSFAGRGASGPSTIESLFFFSFFFFCARALMGSGDRSERIRTFNYAQDRITDHRVNSSVFGVLSFLDGEDLIDSLIDKLKRADAALRLQQMN
jgi:hypothetical protein